MAQCLRQDQKGLLCVKIRLRIKRSILSQKFHRMFPRAHQQSGKSLVQPAQMGAKLSKQVARNKKIS